MSIIDTLFVATNFDNDIEDEYNSQTELVRYEFFEILVRIANAKYVAPGLLGEKENARALQRLFNENIMKVVNAKVFYEWQPFRDKHLWT